MKTQLINSIHDIDVGEWDGLSGGSFYASHSWLAYQETDPASDCSYLLVRDDDDSLLAGVSLYLVHQEASWRYDPARALGTNRPTPHGANAPVLLVGNRRGHSNRLNVIEDDRRSDAVSELIEAVERVAHELAAGTAWWMYLDEDDIALIRSRTGAGPAWLLAGDCTVELPGSRFEDYVQEQSKSRREGIRGDRRRYASAGYETHLRRLSGCWEDIAPLVAAQQRVHGHVASDRAIAELLRGQAESADRQSAVHLARRGRTSFGSHLSFISSAHVTSRSFGFLEGVAHEAAEYFELTYYRPIELAYQLGVPRLHLGVGTLRAKVRRGARVQLRWALRTGPHSGASTAQQNADTWAELSADLSSPRDALTPASRAQIENFDAEEVF